MKQINRLMLSLACSFWWYDRWEPSIIQWFLKKQHILYQNIFPECLGKWILWKILFWAGGRQGKFHTAWQFTLFWAFSKILCHLWLQWAECISYTCATHDILPEFSLCIVATLALRGWGGCILCIACLRSACFWAWIKGIIVIFFRPTFFLSKMRHIPPWEHAVQCLSVHRSVF